MVLGALKDGDQLVFGKAEVGMKKILGKIAKTLKLNKL